MSSAVRAASASNARLLSALSTPPNVLVVGGTSGIGQAIVLAIARHCPTASITIVGETKPLPMPYYPNSARTRSLFVLMHP